MESIVKRKVTAKLDYREPQSGGVTRKAVSRPGSPVKTTPKSPAIHLSIETPLRPKAKINGSAQLNARRPATAHASPTPRVTASLTPRAASPFKPNGVHEGRLSPGPKASRPFATSRPLSKTSSPHVQSIFPSEPTPSTVSLRRRNPSISSISALSSSSINKLNAHASPLSSSPPNSPLVQKADNSSDVGNIRVKAKVSRMAISKPSSSSLSSPLTATPTSSSNSVPARLTGSEVSANTSPSLWSITAPNSTANSHRYTMARRPSASFGKQAMQYQAFAETDKPSYESAVSLPPHPKATITESIDPAFIPLPPQSPPTSMVSFSSRSSTSRRSSLSLVGRSSVPITPSRVSEEAELNNVEIATQPESHEFTSDRVDPARPRANSSFVRSSELLNVFSSSPSLIAEEYTEHQGKAEAKSIRKIADLEITNQSLLAINATLERTKHKQAKEIRELRRKLRESRLILPPPAFRAVSSLDSEDQMTDDDDDDDAEDQQQHGKGDETFNRVKSMIETLLEAGKAALEAKVDDFMDFKGGTKVLHEVEARPWRERTHDIDESVQDISISWDDSFVALDVAEHMSTGSASPTVSGTEREGVLARSEDEVEDLIDEDDDDGPQFGSPPITVTYSP